MDDARNGLPPISKLLKLKAGEFFMLKELAYLVIHRCLSTKLDEFRRNFKHVPDALKSYVTKLDIALVVDLKALI